MEVSRLRPLRGPNLWSRHTAFEAVVRCTTAEAAVDSVPGFEDTLRGLFPGVPALRVTSQQGPLTLAHALEATALALQIVAGCPVTFSRTAASREAGLYRVVVEYSEEDVGRQAFDQALALVQYAWCVAVGETPQGEAPDVPALVAGLRELDEDIRLGPSTGSIVNAAVARGIPFRRLTQGSLVQFGWGVKQRRIQAAEVDATSAVSEDIAQDKDLTKQLLHAAGVPVPIGSPVSTFEQACEVAERIGWPVVAKPLDGSQGRGVTVNIATREQLESGYRSAEGIGEVLIEKYLPGNDFRLLVVGDRLVAAARRDPPNVIGDGVSTVRQLVDKVNTDPRRGDGHATALTKIRLDDIARDRLAQQGLHPEAVPEKGRRVVLRNNANLSTGGSATDVTDEVHPEVSARAVDAARMVGLHVCGVDVVCESVQRPLEEQSGGIVEVNAAPGLRMHLNPSYGKGRNVGQAIMADLYPAGDDGRIPIVAVTGVNGKTTTTRLIAHLIASTGKVVGMTNTDGVYVGPRQTDSGDCSGPKSARSVLMHPEAQAAVLETARGGILREGLGFDRCQVAVVTNVGEGDHLGMNFVDTVEDLAEVKQVIVQNVSPQGHAVLNAADPLVAAMASECPGQVIYFAVDGHDPVVVRHRARGQKVLFVEGGAIVAAQGGVVARLPLADVPLTRGGRLGFQVENSLAAVGAAWALGMGWDDLRAGLASFMNDADNAPGRFNVMNFHGATLIADYGHNVDAMRALVSGVEVIPATRRTVVISGAGDRRDEDLRGQTRILGEHFDFVVLYEDACQRGRKPGEVVALLREGLEGASRAKAVESVVGEFVAIDLALAQLKPGELCLVLVDQVEEALAHLARRCAKE